MRTPFALLFTSCQSFPRNHIDHIADATPGDHLDVYKDFVRKAPFFLVRPGSRQIVHGGLSCFCCFLFVLDWGKTRYFLGKLFEIQKQSKAWWLSWYHVSMFQIQQCHTLSGIWINQFCKSVIFLANLAAVVFFSVLCRCPVGLHRKALV